MFRKESEYLTLENINKLTQAITLEHRPVPYWP